MGKKDRDDEILELTDEELDEIEAEDDSDDAEEKIALAQEQGDSLLAFAAGDPVYKKYCDEIIILLGTGLRISELCGLTADLDFEGRQINVTTSF